MRWPVVQHPAASCLRGREQQRGDKLGHSLGSAPQQGAMINGLQLGDTTCRLCAAVWPASHAPTFTALAGTPHWCVLDLLGLFLFFFTYLRNWKRQITLMRLSNSKLHVLEALFAILFSFVTIIITLSTSHRWPQLQSCLHFSYFCMWNISSSGTNFQQYCNFIMVRKGKMFAGCSSSSLPACSEQG